VADDQRLHHPARRVQALHDAQAERGGFAAARLGWAMMSLPFQNDGQAARLDGRHVGIPELLQNGQLGLGQGKAGKWMCHLDTCLA